MALVFFHFSHVVNPRLCSVPANTDSVVVAGS